MPVPKRLSHFRLVSELKLAIAMHEADDGLTLLVFYDSILKEKHGHGETLKFVKAYCDQYL
jgi:hypothetical protein